MNNLIISYDLYAPGQSYQAVADVIESLGDWARVHRSVWYLRTSQNESVVADRIWAAMDANDTLMVVNASTNQAVWYNVSDDVTSYIQARWHRALPRLRSL